MNIRLDDILHHFVARTGAPSTFGAQLDAMRVGTASTPDPFRSRSQAEDRLLETAGILRCVAEFTGRQEFRSNGRTSFKALQKVQKAATHVMLDQGVIAHHVLRAYQEWSTSSQERALAAVYQYLGRIAPSVIPPLPSSEADLADAFKAGKSKRARDFAAEIYADSLLALSAFLTQYNKQVR